MAEAPAAERKTFLPEVATKYSRPAFSALVCTAVIGLGIDATTNGHKYDDVIGVYVTAIVLTVIGVVLEVIADNTRPQLTQNVRLDVGCAFVAYGLIRIESTHDDSDMYFHNRRFQIGMDMFFFLAFVGAKMFHGSASREVAMLVMSDVVDFVELTFSIAPDCDTGKSIPKATKDAIVCFTFVFVIVSLVMTKNETPGQKALTALVQGLFVHLPIIIIRLALPINEGGMASFNAVFIAKNVVELVNCVLDFLEAGAAPSYSSGPAYESLS